MDSQRLRYSLKQPLRALEQDNPLDTIETWQSGLCSKDEVELQTGIIGSLYNSLMNSLRGLLHDLNKHGFNSRHYRTIEKYAAALLFWGDDHGISQGQLDMALQSALFLRDTVLLVLISLGEFLSQDFLKIFATSSVRASILGRSGLIAQVEKAKYALEEPEDSYSPESEEMSDEEELCLLLEAKIQSLGRLDPILQCLPKDNGANEITRSGLSIHDRPAHQYFADVIAAKYPSADVRTVQRLGEANWFRWNHLQKQRENAQAEAEVYAASQARSEFHDSGFGSTPSMAQSTYAATVVSNRAKDSHRRLPQLPKKARLGEPFKCEICHRIVKIRRTEAWKKHIFSDICAYTCVYNHCSYTGVLFDSQDAMSAHLNSQHKIGQKDSDHTCPLCLQEVDGNANQHLLHYLRHMEEVALGVLPAFEDNEEDSDSSTADSNEALAVREDRFAAGSVKSTDSIVNHSGLSPSLRPSGLTNQVEGVLPKPDSDSFDFEIPPLIPAEIIERAFNETQMSSSARKESTDVHNWVTNSTDPTYFTSPHHSVTQSPEAPETSRRQAVLRPGYPESSMGNHTEGSTQEFSHGDAWSTRSHEDKKDKRRPSFLDNILPKRTPSNLLKRKNRAPISQAAVAGSDKSKEPILEKPRRIGSWGRPKLPSADTGLSSDSRDSGLLSGASLSGNAGPWYPTSRDLLIRSGERRDTGRSPGLRELMTQHGGPPMPMLATLLTEEEATESPEEPDGDEQHN
ncbi:hypothetical protein BKA63DRAFT_67376 [Paraphoma chrysanthemicola]|nr:hypothetical protein BKA63DRAFT_67376 [Paraphoma chrysanthemicola]